MSFVELARDTRNAWAHDEHENDAELRDQMARLRSTMPRLVPVTQDQLSFGELLPSRETVKTVGYMVLGAAFGAILTSALSASGDEARSDDGDERKDKSKPRAQGASNSYRG